MSQQFHHIQALINTQELQQIHQLITQATFIDGKSTATMAAKEVKDNFQLSTDDAAEKAIQQILENAISQSPYFQAAAQPKRNHRFIISKYGPKQFYGWHVDSPIMGNPPLRTDLAMTIFLSDPSSYSGGELMLQTAAGVVAFKPNQGDAILYPCQFLHCVNEITSGERIAAVTWVQSNIQNTEQRQLLFELNQVHAILQQRDKHAPEAKQLLQSYSNLFRMWADV